jgi:hypothetical protein
MASNAFLTVLHDVSDKYDVNEKKLKDETIYPQLSEVIFLFYFIYLY